MTPLDTGNHFFDKVDERLTISPDGPIDGIPAWSADNPAVTLTPAADGLSCDVTADADIASPVTVTVSVGVDVPATPERDISSQTFLMTFSHSKAQNLNPGASEVPKV